MPGRIESRGDFKFDNDMAKLEKSLTKVDTSGMTSLGRVVRKLELGLEKLGRLITGHGWISKEQAAVKKLDKAVKDLRVTHQELREVYGKSNLPEDVYTKFNQEVMNRLENMRKICMLARTHLGTKVLESDVSVVEKDLGELISDCEKEIEHIDLEARKKELKAERKEAKARPKEAVTEPIKGVKHRLETQLERKELKDRVVQGLKMELGHIREQLPIAKDKDAEERLKRFDEIVAMKEWPINEAGANRLFAEIKDIVFRTYHNANTDMPVHMTDQLNAFRDILKTKFEDNG